MAGDYTRFRYNPVKDTSGVQMQQGRVLLDQDWNEYVQLQDRRWRAESIDIMGRAVVPSDTLTGFALSIGGASFTIGIGRMYVDGLLAENHGIDPADTSKRVYDPMLGELIGTAPIPYEQQPYYPVFSPFPADGKPHMVYLDVWERELTYLEDPGLIDQAVAVDTGTRVQTVWQVKVLPDTSVDCSTLPWTVAAIAPSAGRLTTVAAGVASSTDPCIVPPNGGYRGSDNRCYRIEVHNGGPLGTAQFKWSRDNASVASAVTGINATLDTLTVVLTRRDSVLRFQPDDWVEVTDDHRYFQGLPGEMRQVASVDDVSLTIKLKKPLTAAGFDATKSDRHTRVIRWDQHGIVRDPLGNPIVDVDISGGLIPVPAAGTTIVLEDGIQITFGIDGAMPVPGFNALDYWMFAARVIDASVENLIQAPPRGILHHYAWLGFVTLPGGPATDCRVFWPPAFGDCCCCTRTVGPGGTFRTIQEALDAPGVNEREFLIICLRPGVFVLSTPVRIRRNNVVIVGCGGRTFVVAPNPVDQRVDVPAFIAEQVDQVTIESMTIQGGSTWAIWSLASNLRVHDCKITSGGIWIADGSSDVEICDNELSGGSGPGIALRLLPLGFDSNPDNVDIDEVRITRNIIYDFADSGIVCGVEQANQAAATVSNLEIFDNRLLRCGLAGARDPYVIRADPPFLAAGGIALNNTIGTAIHHNRIQDCGGQQPACGIVLVLCAATDISHNLILNNGIVPKPETQNIPFQAGVLAAASLDAPDGRAAVRITDNSVVTPAGQSLLLLIVGSAAITGNRLHSNAVFQQATLGDTLPGAPSIGISLLVFMFPVPPPREGPPQFVDERLLFQGNQLRSRVSLSAERCSFFSPGDVAISGNQFLGQNLDHQRVGLHVSMVALTGNDIIATARVTDNRISDPGDESSIQVFAKSLVMTGNQTSGPIFPASAPGVNDRVANNVTGV